MFCVDRNGAAAEETVGIIKGEGGNATAFTADVSRAGEVEAMVAACLKAHGRIDVLDNNVGIAEMGSVVETTESEWDRVFAVNLKSVWLCMKEEIRHMLQQGGGSIVNTGSIAGLVGLPTSSAYVAAKHGVLGLTKTAALEYADANIRVNAVCPGYIETRMTEEVRRRRGEAILNHTPMHRMGTPGEIAEMVVWLLSERASYVTGACYNVDGGWMAM